MQHVPWAKRRLGTFRYSLADSAIATPDLAGMGLPVSAPYPGDAMGLANEIGELLGRRIASPEGRVLVTAGASEALAVVFSSALERGEEVLAESPGYEPHRLVPPLFGLALRTFPHPADGVPGRIAEAVARAIGPATRLVALSDLQNPSGVRIHERDFEELDALAAEHDLRILVDETFRDCSDRPAGTVAARGPRWLATGSLTKSFGLGGMRIGWVAGDADALDAAAETHNALSAQPSRPSLVLARELAPHLGRLIGRTRGILEANRSRWGQSVERGRGVFTASPSEGTVTWCRFAGEGGGDAFAAFADERFGLGVVPGGFFGDRSGVRVSLGNEPQAFIEAADAWDRAVAAFAGASATREPA